ncbi:hypothetical protein L228DRAFT_282609 [Xylona heveae TC161]|uniref:Uncharacterized protein n=1 Tax=Xylona heveae (strain CBS 132557 / TC161) TaxID=1328760 RepID=A0A165GRC6_XYLHT|nr:hypothetical protein L228DRAFT_282609 [Xylona heveae TC161]KZF22498.1 hypothetical protein L228DRAFT_282609 [Xylona heveae TC161]
MAWLSILPAHLNTVEGWLVRLFILFALLTIGPWAILLVYDVLLYIWRSAAYEVPVVGGRAHGRRRPRAPSLTERPSGRPRRFSLSQTISSTAESSENTDNLRKRPNPQTSDQSNNSVH